MQHSFTAASILVIALIAWKILSQRSPLVIIMFISGMIRLGYLVIAINFPESLDGIGDQVKYELQAFQIAEARRSGSFESDLFNQNLGLSWGLSIFYTVFGRDPLLIRLLAMSASLVSIVYFYRIARMLSDKKASRILTSFFAFYPAIVLYSCSILNEPFIILCLVVSTYFLLSYLRRPSTKHAFFSLTILIPAIFLHGGLIIGFVITVFILGVYRKAKFKQKFTAVCLNVVIFVLPCLIIGAVLLDVNNLSLNKLGKLSDLISLETYFLNMQLRQFEAMSANSTAIFPEWLLPESLLEYSLTIPVRYFYFLFSPFPWDINNFRQIIGLLDSLMIAFFWVLILSSAPRFTDRKFFVLISLYFAYTALFSMGVVNFGTAFRHRAKFFFIELLILSLAIKRNRSLKKRML